MDFQSIKPPAPVELLVRNIWVFKNLDDSEANNLPFFADGFPGLVYQHAEKEAHILPQNKTLPHLFIYGQTLEPVQIKFEGNFRLIVFQFFPFVLKQLFSVDPKKLEDDCMDLAHWYTEDIKAADHSFELPTDEFIIAKITQQVLGLLEEGKVNINKDVLNSVDLIIENSGLIKNKTIAQSLGISVRTLERNFLKETGLTPKQFAQIFQFHTSLAQLTTRQYQKLTDIVYRNGYADQSHFIRVFKKFTGKTPRSFFC